MDFEITYAKTESDLMEIADMMAKVFASRSYFDFYKTRNAVHTADPYYKPEFSRIVKVAGKIVSHVSIVEKHMFFGNAVIKVAGIGDVFTHPDFRGQNFTKILMEDAIKYMAENDFTVSMLYGIMNFYHKFGYIESVLTPKLTVQIRNLSAICSEKTLRPFEKKDIPELTKLFNAHYQGKNLSVKRIPESWYLIPQPNTCFIVPDKKDKPVAYVITSVPPNKKPLTFYVKEAVASDKESAAAIASFLRDMAQDICMSAIEVKQRPDSYFSEYLSEFGGDFNAHIPFEGDGGGMLRIVLLKKLFEELKEELNTRVSLRCDSPDIQIVFKTDIGSISVECKKRKIQISDKGEKGSVIIKTPQNALIRLITGYYNTEKFLQRTDNTKINETAKTLLKIIFPQDFPYTSEPDYF